MEKASEHCVGVDGIKVIGESSKLSAAAQLQCWAALYLGEDSPLISLLEQRGFAECEIL